MASGKPVVLTSVTQNAPTVTATTFSGSPSEVADQIDKFFGEQNSPGMKEAGEALKRLLSGDSDD
jgi:alkanesulfonate monooxygenase SsuD/methylene tetrahydromethanopterin reductase-like flavin-dependent oxidoreductase (luciferase family)